ncbi:hypothetical protein [Streptomyces sp. NBC_01304]|uniref:hypothetical protein n=1 Tax=Streptomyces sp. NBC_01304 TaxID=2903818 RepID=UPI002E1452EC|nr:hypothetical protein OG430_00935 [Streptomyces sp. NBC_01304]
MSYRQSPQQPGPYGAQSQPQSAQPQLPPLPPGPPAVTGKNSGRKLAIVTLALAVTLAGGGAWYFLSQDSDGPNLRDDGKSYELTMPETLLGDYKLSNADEAEDDVTYEEMKQLGIERAHAIDPVYRAGDGTDSSPSFRFDGLWGEVADPPKTLDLIMAALPDSTGNGDRVKAVGDPQSVRPQGLDNAVMKCQKVAQKHENLEWTYCVWADYDTIGILDPQKDSYQGGETYSIDEAAQLAADLRAEVRREVK